MGNISRYTEFFIMIVMYGDHQILINYVHWRSEGFAFGSHRRIQAVYAYISWNTRKFSTPLRYSVIGILT
jgi:hypothetical protein